MIVYNCSPTVTYLIITNNNQFNVQLKEEFQNKTAYGDGKLRVKGYILFVFF